MEQWLDDDFKTYFFTKERHQMPFQSHQEIVEKYDALKDEMINVHKITLEKHEDIWQTKDKPDAYENRMPIFQKYIYDKDIKIGMPHIKVNGKLQPYTNPEIEEKIEEIISLDELVNAYDDEKQMFKSWAKLLEYPAPDFKRAALDIEVWMEEKQKMPIPEVAICPVTCACFSTNKGEKIAYVLIQEGKIFTTIPKNSTKVVFFTNERDLLQAIFNTMLEYPFIITFNGDGFDLKYLFYRALRFNFNEENIPIIVKPKICIIKNRIHIDLYKFFFIKAMKVYAFKNKYKDISLEEVSQALLGRGKIDRGELINDLNYHDLINYCMNDSDLTLELTTYNNNLVMNLITVIQRMSRLPIENVSRRNVGSWIRSILEYEHIQRNILIPTQNDIMLMKGKTQSHALIKGKKYKGAVVFDTITGVHFNSAVMDFASLYPSIIKVYNLGYSTIDCPHEECKLNKIGELDHWICKKNRALESLLIGSLRELRVFWYKKKAKDKTLDIKLQNWYSVVEQSIKVIMNASYGVFGATSFSLYCPPLAEETTAIARFIILDTADRARSMGIIVLGGDTDSIFIKKPTQEQIKILMDWALETHGIELEVDKEYRFLCLSERKKNYYGVFTNGEIDIKGLTGKKKHTPQIIKLPFEKIKKLLEEINTPEEMEQKKHEIVVTLRETYQILKQRKWNNIMDLSFNMTLSKGVDKYDKTMPQHVKAAKLLVDKGIQVEAGSNVNFVKTFKKVKHSRGYKIEEDVKPVELAKNEEIFIDKYTEFLQSVFEQILDPLGIDYEEQVLGKTKLFSYF